MTNTTQPATKTISGMELAPGHQLVDYKGDLFTVVSATTLGAMDGTVQVTVRDKRGELAAYPFGLYAAVTITDTRTAQPGDIYRVPGSRTPWTVEKVDEDGTLHLITAKGTRARSAASDLVLIRKADAPA